MFAPQSFELKNKWRFAKPDLWRPGLQLMAVVGCAWALWRAFSYPLAIELWPYLTFWLSFAAWFILGALACWDHETASK